MTTQPHEPLTDGYYRISDGEASWIVYVHDDLIGDDKVGWYLEQDYTFEPVAVMALDELDKLRAELANQYQRIDRFVELVDQLEQQLAALKSPQPDNVPLYANEKIDDIVDNHIFLDNGTGTYKVFEGRANKYLREMRGAYEREIAFWQRYGVVKNLELAALKAQGGYSHRNGETQLPTIQGWYWFKGIAMGERYEGSVIVGEAIAGNLCVEGSGESSFGDIREWGHGQWWGPIVPPWNKRTTEAQGVGVPLEQPDSPGWWAFEGKWNSEAVTGTFQDVCEVQIFQGELQASLGFDWEPVGSWVGKWYRLHLPWEAQRPTTEGE